MMPILIVLLSVATIKVLRPSASRVEAEEEY